MSRENRKRREVVSRAPARFSGRAAVLAALVATVAIGVGAVPAAGLGALSIPVAGLALLRSSRRLLGVSVAFLLLGVLFAGLVGAPPESLLVAMVATVLVWDAGENAISVGEQLGREADTRRLEVVHLAAGTALATAVAGVGYAVYEVASGGQPAAAIVLLLLGAILLISTLRD